MNDIGQARRVECFQIDGIYKGREFQSVVSAVEREVARKCRAISANRKLVDLADRFGIPDMRPSISNRVVIDRQIIRSNVTFHFYCG